MKTSFIFAGAVIAVAAAAAFTRPAQPFVPPTQASTSFDIPANSASTQKTSAENPASLVVYVAGEVLRPGLYRLPPTARAQAALRAAGGPTGRADLVAVNLAEPLHDGEEIVIVPRGAYAPADDAQTDTSDAGDAYPSTPRKHASRHRRHHHRRAKHKLPSAPIDLNSADEAQLESLPGVGPGLASRILAYRELNGPFSSVDDLLDVAGITERKLQRLSPYVLMH